MKKVLIILTLLLSCMAHAQLHIDQEVANQTNYALGLLDKNKIPHQMLLDYGYDFVDVANYDGELRDNNYIVPAIYRDLYNSVVSMRTSLTVPDLVDPETLEQGWKSASKSYAGKLGKGALTTPVALTGMYYKYARIREDALDQGLIQIVDQSRYEDVYQGTEWQNPYETDEVFAMALPFTRINNSKVSLLLEPAEWRTNQGTVVDGFAVDFGDGNGFQPLSLSVPVDYQFQEDGDYVWTFRLKLSDGSFKYCRTPVKITGKATQQTLTARNPQCTAPWIETITATKAYLGEFAVAQLEISQTDMNCNQVIKKPLIVVEGFDSGLTQNHPIYGDTHLEVFLKSVENYSQSQELQNLITEDTEESFDIIYVNWANGTDWLQRNAYALEAVIEWVNSKKLDPSVPNVVLGQSMGGVIARYALRDMENNNLNHDTSLYISHDAPHQGAHVPPGFLYGVRHVLNELITTPIGDITVAIASGELPINEARQLIDRPAVKQLLINWVDANYNINNDAHKAWQNELKAMGYPQQTRNIALSNGSHCASPYGIAPGQNLFRLHGAGSTNPVGDILSFISPLLGGGVGALFGDVPATLLGFLPGKSTLKIDFRAWSIPGVNANTIYRGWIQYEKKNLWIIPITRTITDRSFSWESEKMEWSNYPGGAMPFIETVDQFEDIKSNVFVNYNLNLELEYELNFIPVTSALDVGGNNLELTEEDHYRPYIMGEELPQQLAIPFDNFTTTYEVSGGNAAHISFNRANGDWLANELKETAMVLNCNFLCSNVNQIEGSETLCDEEIYYVDVLGDTEVTWSSSNPNAATPTDPFSPATSFTTYVNTYQEQVTLTATLYSPSCGGVPVVLEKVVQVGKPGLPSDLSGPQIVLTGALVNYTGGPAEGAQWYEWWLPHPFESVNQFDYFGQNWQVLTSNTYYNNANVFTGYAKNNGYVQLMGVNNCGRGGARMLYVKHAEDGELGEGGIPLEPNPSMDLNSPNHENEDSIILYPNTATDVVHIALASNENERINSPSTILGITIYEQLQQTPKRSLSFSSTGISSTQLDVSDLKDGYYFVVIQTDMGPVTKILLVK
jgi:hypothetical protein